ncbi:unnamed protein product [Victoria cruziana]
MKPSPTKLILLQSHLHKLQKQGYFRLWLLGFISFLTLATFATLLCRDSAHHGHLDLSLSLRHHRQSPSSGRTAGLPADAVGALLHYLGTNVTGGMSAPDARILAGVVSRKCPCNLLVFGLNHESLLWKTLNLGGRTVFLDESEFWVKRMEERHPGIEAYDVQYTTKVAEMKELRRAAVAAAAGDCRPVQNLLFSDCPLAINDLPNELYGVDWDVVIVDGPRGYSPAAPGRMSAIFTAGVLARSKRAGPATDVFVHDYAREVEKVYSQEFLCSENRVPDSSTESLGHFRLPAMPPASTRFCLGANATKASG